jgi:hypothetical protein
LLDALLDRLSPGLADRRIGGEAASRPQWSPRFTSAQYDRRQEERGSLDS